MTKELTPEGYFVLKNHTLARLQFRNVDNQQLSGFSYQNVIFELIFGREPMQYRNAGPPIGGPHPEVLTVKIDSSVGLSGEFCCQSAEVVSAESCDEDGRQLSSLS